MTLIVTSVNIADQAILDTANSYQTLEEANAYFDTHLYADTWSMASSTIKERALIWATRILDTNIEWDGIRQTETQALEWPRMNVVDRNRWIIRINVIPKQVKWAQAELAQLLMVENRMVEIDAKGMQELWIDRFTRFVFDKQDIKHVIPEYIVSLISQFGTYVGNEAAGSNETVQLVRG